MIENPKSLEGLWPPTKYLGYPVAPYLRAGTSTRWAATDLEDVFEQNGKIGHANLYGKNDIWYHYNKWGFRTVEFDKIGPSTLRIVCVGCSNTEGIGLPLEHTWPHLLTERLNTEWYQSRGTEAVGINLGVGGSSNRSIALRTIRAIETLKPSIVFVGWSFLHRVQYVHADGDLVDWWSPNDAEKKSNDPKLITKRIYFESIQNDLNDQSGLMYDITAVNLAAKLHGVPVCHNFMYLDRQFQNWLMPRVDGLYNDTKPIWSSKTARDLLHPGLDYNRWATQYMFEWVFQKGQS